MSEKFPKEFTGNVLPLLNEIRHALKNFIDNNKTHTIDLFRIPLAPGEKDIILETLGKGEITIKLEALGTTEIIETKFPGVWLITHYNQDDKIISHLIEITNMPSIALSVEEDINHSIKSLNEKIQELEF